MDDGLLRWLSRNPFARRQSRALARLLRLTTNSLLTLDNRPRLSRLRISMVGRLLKIYHRLQDFVRRASWSFLHRPSCRPTPAPAALPSPWFKS